MTDNELMQKLHALLHDMTEAGMFDDTLGIHPDRINEICDAVALRVAGNERASPIGPMRGDDPEHEPLPLEQAIAEAKAAEASEAMLVASRIAHGITDNTDDTNNSAAVIRDYTVMMRRPVYQFATGYVSAASPREAVAKMRKVADEPAHFNRWDWSDDDAQNVDWVHAELSTHEEGTIDDDAHYAEWEEATLSPDPLLKALNRIMVLAGTPANEVAMGSALSTIIEIAAQAIHEAVPHE